MTLISLLVVILLERMALTKSSLHYASWYNIYRNLLADQIKFDSINSLKKQVLICLLLPVLILFYIQHLLGFSLFGILFSCLILFVCLGCPNQRMLYKKYLEAANRGDKQACYEYARQLGMQVDEQEQCKETFGQTLVWLNFRHYISVIFWFALLGPAGAILYAFSMAMLSEIQKLKAEGAETPFVHAEPVLDHILLVLNFVPARIATFAYMFVGNFSNAVGYWFEHLFDTQIDTREYVRKVAVAAEDFTCPDGDCLTEPKVMLKLAKRAVVFCIAVIATLTIAGILQ
ncbi:beta-lactamase regulator AmpE [Catenovulum sp. SM1970]|uniref:beta-lactamase regulator AmpE n=1 Tax=Marinifaba aquimaris TaxID=2741323 RepID=UPI00157366E6|nr:beta-lactamase regulator AmpE [Marinifaba aquimaris]NTS76567.1 beta-lactamase regulator AmpE [Marinifaba aquimaris]